MTEPGPEPFDEPAHLEAMAALTVRVVRDRRRGRVTPEDVVRRVDVGTVRMLARRAAERRRLAETFESMAARLPRGDERATRSARLAATSRASAERAQRTCDELLASLPGPWAVRAARHLAADSVARRKEPR